ncbi:MAG: DUF5696 domain-containing protein, partial [Opitutaceae bacterium]|nr:DUF5696 domain-containing protein [Opitutaceae bacterium]
ETIEYIFTPQAGLLDGLRIRHNGEVLRSPFRFRAIMASDQTKLSDIDKVRQAADETEDLRKLQKKTTATAAKSRFLDAQIKNPGDKTNERLVATYEFTTATQDAPATTAKLTAELRCIGKTLELRLSSDAPTFHSIEVATRGKTVPSEFQIGDSYRINDKLFGSAIPDLWQSDASELRSNATLYGAMTNDARHPVRDTFYLTLSSLYPETLANARWLASPYMKEFETRLVLDMFEGTFASHLDLLRQLKPYSIDSLLIILHYWQNKGFDRSNPDMMPAHENLGGDAGLRALSQGAHALGHRFSIHENYLDVSAINSPQYTADLARRPDGTLLPHAGGNMYFVKPSSHMALTKDRAAAATKAYDLDATFHDVMPHWKLDYDATAPDAGIFRLAALEQKKYWQAMREQRNGPMVTEMLGPQMSGLWDGGCNAYTDNMRTRKMLPLAELLKVHPKQSNHGIGYYERWLPWGSKPGWDAYKPTDRELDRYRGMQIAFGRVGFIGRQLNNYVPHIHAIVREYHLMRAFGQGYVNRRLRTLEYQTLKGNWITPVEAAESGQWQRLRATYQDGNSVWVNYSDSPWNIDGLALPAWGSATRGPRGTADTQLRDGQISDFSEYENILYADARSHTWMPGSDQPPILPKLGTWKNYGDGSFDLEIIWQPQRALDNEFNSFWHFRDAGSSVSRPVFHSLGTPGKTRTTAWKPGYAYSDTRRIRIPTRDQRTGIANTAMKYDIVVGLTHVASGMSRPQLSDHLNQLRVATMEVEKTNGRITAVKISPAEQPPTPGTDPAAYREGLNTEKKVIDFGKVATNGAFVLRRTDDGRILTPVPKGEAMRVGIAGPVSSVTVYLKNSDKSERLSVTQRGDKTFFDVPTDADHLVIR